MKEYGKDYVRADDYDVVSITQAVALDMLRRWHYSGGGPRTAAYRHALQRKADGALVGVALWLPPIIAAARKVSPDDPHKALALSRLAVSPEVGTNGASLLLGRSIRLIRQDRRYNVLVTYADDRLSHEGGIYKATNWTFDGDTPPYYAWLDAEGRQVCKKSTRNIPAAEMDAKYTRVGPFKKRRFILRFNGRR